MSYRPTSDTDPRCNGVLFAVYRSKTAGPAEVFECEPLGEVRGHAKDHAMEQVIAKWGPGNYEIRMLTGRCSFCNDARSSNCGRVFL